MSKKIKRLVSHPKLYKKVDGKLQKVAPGTEIEVTEACAKKHGAKYGDPAAAKRVAEGKLVDNDSAVKELEAKLKAAEDRAKAAEDALVATTKKK